MTDTLKYQIQPKRIDSYGNETDLDQYSFFSNATVYTEKATTIPATSTYIDLPASASQNLIELQSDQEVTFAIYGSTGNLQIELPGVKHIILEGSLVKTYQIKNIGTTIANVTWRTTAPTTT